MNDLGTILCCCKKPAQLFFSKLKRTPFIACTNYQKRQGTKCEYNLDLTTSENLNLLNSKKGKLSNNIFKMIREII